MRIVRFCDLKVLDTGLSDSTVEVEHVGLRLLVPIRLAIVMDRDLSQICLVEVTKKKELIGAKLNLVDLVGSERVKDSNVQGQNL